jgi:hypothetical protein
MEEMIDGTAIIGTAPSLQGKEMGKYIDSFRYVIRFPYKGDWHVPLHYGTKTTHFCSTDRRAVAQLNSFLPDLGYFIWSKHNADIGPELEFLIAKFGGENVSELINKWQLRQPVREHRTQSNCFSSGTGGFCIAAANLVKQIVGLGCDYIRNGGGPVEDYIGTWFWENGKKPKAGGFRRHHRFDTERVLIDEMAKEYNVEIRFE